MRIDYRHVFPQAFRAMSGLERAGRESSLEPALRELVKIRASELNGCAFCLDMHSKEALARGEDQQRLNVLSAWREAPFYSDRERAALAWCEALTLLSEQGAPEDVYGKVKRQFNEEEIVGLTLAIVSINGWNRFEVGLKSPIGRYGVDDHR